MVKLKCKFQNISAWWSATELLFSIVLPKRLILTSKGIMQRKYGRNLHIYLSTKQNLQVQFYYMYMSDYDKQSNLLVLQSYNNMKKF